MNRRINPKHLSGDNQARTLHHMTELMRLIEAHLDHYGVTRAAFARKCGTNPQTVQNWKARPTTLPQPHHLKAVADVIGLPYEVVLGAALVDAGYRDAVVYDAAALRERLDRVSQRDNSVLAQIAQRLSEDLQGSPPPPRPLEDLQAGPTVDGVADVIRDSLGVDDRHDGGQLGG